jgi:hypothetical protein
MDYFSPFTLVRSWKLKILKFDKTIPSPWEVKTFNVYYVNNKVFLFPHRS